MIQKKQFWQIGKYLLYFLTLIILYAMQTTAGLLEIYGIRPIWVIPFAVAMAMSEDVMTGAIFGALSGLFCDLGSQALFGFNGVLMLCGCTTIGLLCLYLVKANWKSALLLGGALGGTRALLEFFFFYLIWNYEGILLVFLRSTVPMFLYTTALTPAFLWLIRKIKAAFDGKWQE